jgi:hypothetical protein
MSRKRHAQSSCVAVALPLALTLSLPAVAGISKTVTQEDAAEGRVAVVVAAEGGGTIVDFSETGETIKRVTLDDQSKVIMDYSAPLPVIRLFRGNIPPGDVPVVKQTQLTVVTEDSDKQYHTYIFPVTPSPKPAMYTKFLVGGASRKQGVSNGSGLVTTAVSGIRQAERQRTLVDPQLKGRVRRYLQLTQSGMSDRQAAKRSGVSMALVQRLAVLGQGSPMGRSRPAPDPSVLPVPAPPTPTRKLLVVDSLKGLESPGGAEATSPAPNPAPAFQSQTKREPKPKHEPRLFEHGPQPTPKKVEGKPTSTATIDREPKPLWSSVIVPSGVVRANRLSPSVQLKRMGLKQDYANALQRGLNKARIDGKIRYGSNKWYQLNGAIRLLRRGSSLDKAISASGMQRDGFMKLLSDGGIES